MLKSKSKNIQLHRNNNTIMHPNNNQTPAINKVVKIIIIKQLHSNNSNNSKAMVKNNKAIVRLRLQEKIVIKTRIQAIMVVNQIRKKNNTVIQADITMM